MRGILYFKLKEYPKKLAFTVLEMFIVTKINGR
ncbi:hypothetical protein J2W48_003400 [Flavobacterium piscis]|uniref:Prepilin-type N-terminal cleavage/methylation domain-containing protein n=1 Tax=Flavobacterium piscis TaxID=1114874 RepID=A0ABU1YB25_9FLAO|nr:hypothetical protein [Flavobacterium piscis]